MGLPNVSILFKSKAIAAIKSGSVGTLALVLKDSSVAAVTEYIMTDITDMPATLSAANQNFITQAFLGTPSTIKAVVIPDTDADYTNALNYLEAISFNVMAIPAIASGDVTTIMVWVKSMRDTKDRKIIAVLPNCEADHEGIVNFATEDIVVGSDTFSASEYTGRIGGLIAGLDLKVSPTFRKLAEVDDIPKMTKAEADAAVDAGKLILYHDGEKVKIARGVTSLVTTTEDVGSDWKKIKLVRILDKTYTDLKETIEDVYVGSYQNSYVNKLLLITAVNAYYEQLELENVLDSGKNKCEIDLAAQKVYLKSIGEDADNMSDQEIKEANTRDQVFLTSTQRPLDAIEDVSMTINL